MEGGKRRKRYFNAVGKARTFAKIKETEIANQGAASRSIPDDERLAF